MTLLNWVIKSLLIVACMMGIGVPNALAWHTLTHPLIVDRAYHALPPTLQQAFAANLEEVKRGSVLPDLTGDWANHEIDLHPASDFGYPASILHLQKSAEQVTEALRSESYDAAQRLGQFLHYAQDHLHPLHTDNDPRETESLHRQQEQLTYAQRNQLPPFRDPGIQVWSEVENWAEVAIPSANRLYTPWLETSLTGGDTFPLATRAFATAVSDTRDLWVSLWYRAFPDRTRMQIHVNRTDLQPGQGFQITLSSGKVDEEKDTAGSTPSDITLIWYLTSDSALIKTESVRLTENKAMIDAPLVEGEYQLTAQYRGDAASVLLRVEHRPPFDLANLNPAGYVLDARWPHSSARFRQYVRPWDIVAIGGCRDDPLTEIEEGIVSPFIPGDFTHIAVYLGRDSAGRAVAAELTDEIRLDHVAQFRLAVLPEGINDEAPDRLALTEVDVALNACDWRWSRPLQTADRDAVDSVADDLIAVIQRHWEDGFPYQLLYHWSGRLTDKNVWLVDDGLEGGANCTDYWLALFEEIAGVCISGSRMTAEEIKTYFINDPIGAETPIPDVFNPLPIPMTVKAILGLGYRIIDPQPHQFSCDGTEETGVAMPSRLILSPDLGEPSFLPTAAVLTPTSRWWSLASQLYQAFSR
jgi:hypothetical protein